MFAPLIWPSATFFPAGEKGWGARAARIARMVCFPLSQALGKGVFLGGCHLFWTGFLVGSRGWLLLVFDPVGEFL